MDCDSPCGCCGGGNGPPVPTTNDLTVDDDDDRGTNECGGCLCGGSDGCSDDSFVVLLLLLLFVWHVDAFRNTVAFVLVTTTSEDVVADDLNLLGLPRTASMTLCRTQTRVTSSL